MTREVRLSPIDPGRRGMLTAFRTGAVVQGLAVIAHRIDALTNEDVFTVELVRERQHAIEPARVPALVLLAERVAWASLRAWPFPDRGQSIEAHHRLEREKRAARGLPP